MSNVTMRAVQVSARRLGPVSRQALRHASTGPQTGGSSSHVPWIIGSALATSVGVYYSLPAGKPKEKAQALHDKAHAVKDAVVDKKEELKEAALKRDEEDAKRVLPKFEKDGESERDHDKACEADRNKPKRRVHE